MRKNRAKVEQEQAASALEAKDLFAMRLAALELERARERWNRVTAERRAQGLAAQLALTQEQVRFDQAKLAASEAEKAEAAKYAEAEAEQTKLAAEIGKRYAVDWKATAFDSESGVLMPLPR